ncbi:hypothetical protein FACS1894140_2920 [Spirochaetia bacterium]|nr:hypothetical protein FACS1894140_2920 [Spirochaetia bacterium]
MKVDIKWLIPVCLMMAVVPVLTVSGETPDKPAGPAILGVGDLPASRSWYIPKSGTSKATLGAVSSDTDAIMSVFDFSSLQAEKYFGYTGVDESIQDGLNIGFGTKFGKNNSKFFSVAYGGSLINELAMLLTNQNVTGMKKRESVETEPGETTFRAVSDLVDSKGDSLPSKDTPYTSDNTLSFLIGSGPVGFRFGFSEFLQGTKIRNDDYQATIIESSLKPFFEVGLSVGKDRFRFKPAFRLAYDIHQYNSTQIWSDPANPPGVTVIRLLDFTEPSAGFTLGFDFNHSEHTQAEFDLNVDLAYRVYSNNGKWGVSSTYLDSTGANITYDAFTEQDPANPMEGLIAGLGEALGELSTLPVADLRLPLNLGFTYRNDFSRRFTLGFNADVDGQVDFFRIKQTATDPAGTETEYNTIAIKAAFAPDVSVGVKFDLLPDHFAVQGGLGIELFSYEQVIDTSFSDADPDAVKKIERTIGVPTVRLAGGISLNFTKNTALDLLAIAANVANIDKTKFTMQFTFKK